MTGFSMSRGFWIGALATIVVASAAVLSIAQRPPSLQREYRFDQIRLQALLEIQRRVDNYWQKHKTLPEDLNAIRYSSTAWHDPLTGQPYTYQVTGDGTYKLCTVFAQNSEEPQRSIYASADWRHSAGIWCFDRSVRGKETP